MRGMRNAMNSWALSDSVLHGNDVPEIGEKDMGLAKCLIRDGSSDSKFLRMIGISMDIVAPEYWWQQWDTYKIGVVRNSCSKMHKLMAGPFTEEMFSTEHLLTSQGHNHFTETIRQLNRWRQAWLNSSDTEERKLCWWQIMQQLPQSYNQRSTVTLNYQVARKMYHERRYHKLDEWHTLCHVFEGLPYSEFITMDAGGE